MACRNDFGLEIRQSEAMPPTYRAPYANFQVVAASVACRKHELIIKRACSCTDKEGGYEPHGSTHVVPRNVPSPLAPIVVMLIVSPRSECRCDMPQAYLSAFPHVTCEAISGRGSRSVPLGPSFCLSISKQCVTVPQSIHDCTITNDLLLLLTRSPSLLEDWLRTPFRSL